MKLSKCSCQLSAITIRKIRSSRSIDHYDVAMSDTDTGPPPILDSARVLCYAVVDGSVGCSGRTLLFVGGVEVGGVPYLAIRAGAQACIERLHERQAYKGGAGHSALHFSC